jgi:hypothetical protein
MLREEKNIRQITGEPPRRWFADEFFDLIVWLDPDGSLWGFQLCYDRGYAPRALTWTKAKGYTHEGIDDGEVGGGAHKGSPILVQDGVFDAEPIGDRLSAASRDLPPGISAFVLEKVKTFNL